MMGWMAPLRHRRAKLVFSRITRNREPSMSEITTIGLDLAKHFACIDVDGCACENEPGYLAGIPAGIGKRHPAALTHSYQIGVALELVHNNVEISKVAVN